MTEEQFKKELALKDEEYIILKNVSDQIEEEQRRQIYELEQILKKANEFVSKYIDEARMDIPFNEVCELNKILNNEEVE